MLWFSVCLVFGGLVCLELISVWMCLSIEVFWSFLLRLSRVTGNIRVLTFYFYHYVL